MRNSFIMLTVLLTGMLISCSTHSLDPDYEEQLILTGYLYTGQPIDSITIARTFPFDTKYDRVEGMVSDATVLIATTIEEYRLQEYPEKPGVYFLPDTSVRVTAGQEYRIEVQYGEHRLLASTTAPEQVEIEKINTDSLQFLDPGQKFRLSWNLVDGADAYVLSSIASPTPRSPYAGRLADYGEEGVMEYQLAQFHGDTLRAFPAVSPYGVDGIEDQVEFPWFMFNWYGNYTIKLYAVRDEMMDIIISSQQADTFEPPADNVDGGLGIFTAMSVDSIGVCVYR